MHNKNNKVISEDLKTVSDNDLVLTYEVYGHGENKLLCFHGHGKSAKDYAFLETPHRTVISVNLFFHGGSFMPEQRIEKKPVTPKEIYQLIQLIFVQEKCENDAIHLIAYSQGGRFGIALLPYFMEQFASIHFIAVDGMDDNNIYSRTQRKYLARKLFKYWTKKPKSLVFIAQLLVKIRIIHPKLFELLTFYTSDPKRFIISYKAWAAFRALRTDEIALKKLFKNYPNRFKLIIGQYDQIITSKTAKQFLKRIEREDALMEIPFGHDVFKASAQKYIFEKIMIE